MSREPLLRALAHAARRRSTRTGNHHVESLRSSMPLNLGAAEILDFGALLGDQKESGGWSGDRAASGLQSETYPRHTAMSSAVKTASARGVSDD